MPTQSPPTLVAAGVAVRWPNAFSQCPGRPEIIPAPYGSWGRRQPGEGAIFQPPGEVVEAGGSARGIRIKDLVLGRSRAVMGRPKPNGAASE